MLAFVERLHWNGGLVEVRHHHMHHVFRAQHTCATDFYLKMWYDFIEKSFLCITFRDIYWHKP